MVSLQKVHNRQILIVCMTKGLIFDYLNTYFMFGILFITVILINTLKKGNFKC